jgi:hypothetical protein
METTRSSATTRDGRSRSRTGRWVKQMPEKLHELQRLWLVEATAMARQ